MVKILPIRSTSIISDTLIIDCQRTTYFRKSGLDGDTNQQYGRYHPEDEPLTDPHC